MTEQQLIDELLLEAAGLGIKQEVMDASEKYLDQGLDQLEALEKAFNDVTSDWDDDEDEDDDWDDDDYEDIDLDLWPDDEDE